MTIALLWLFTGYAHAADYRVVTADSVLSIVTHKAGLIESLGHNHFVHATDYQAEIQCQPDDLLQTRIAFTIDVQKLQADESAEAKRWTPILKDLAFAEEDFSEQSESNRKKIRKSMLGKKQLQADKYPSIKAEIIGIEEREKTVGTQTFTHSVEIAITIKDQTVKKPFPATLTIEEGKLIVRIVGEMKFTDFGIKPYSAAFGAVANQDQIHLFVHLVAEPEGSTP
ncbi:YceI family protein [Sulfidibacter corallicola]|uniref:YceI family protein n=1 Tax=Sulfidibacter corallicola TaxID=2818388 RepID=A0A8A4TPV3_SULCO|nr:YceI family protein [Sulfidibacter corallicola]QTD51999.1 YceI family protein [Sulfidibacter corallicola]